MYELIENVKTLICKILGAYDCVKRQYVDDVKLHTSTLWTHFYHMTPTLPATLKTTWFPLRSNVHITTLFRKPDIFSLKYYNITASCVGLIQARDI